ncbi:hypothetical protein RCZ04_00160 [Capnocytophaga sp. HP1101]
MKKKSQLYFSIWCLLSVIFAPIIVGTYFFYQDFYNINAIEVICGTIFFTAYVLFPLFLMYQIIIQLKDKGKRKEFTISIIAFVLMLISILFYIGFYCLIDMATSNTYKSG